MRLVFLALTLLVCTSRLHAVTIDYDLTEANVTTGLFSSNPIPLVGLNIPPSGAGEVWLDFRATNGDKQHIAVDGSDLFIAGSVLGDITEPGQGYDAELILSGVTGTLDADAYTNADVSIGSINSFTNAGQINFFGDLENVDFIFHDLHVQITADAANTSGFTSTTISFIIFDEFGDGEISIGVDTIPEPTTLALMGLGLAGIGYQRRRKQC